MADPLSNETGTPPKPPLAALIGITSGDSGGVNFAPHAAHRASSRSTCTKTMKMGQTQTSAMRSSHKLKIGSSFSAPPRSTTSMGDWRHTAVCVCEEWVETIYRYSNSSTRRAEGGRQTEGDQHPRNSRMHFIGLLIRRDVLKDTWQREDARKASGGVNVWGRGE